MLRIFSRTSVWPPRAVGFETSTSRQWYGAPSCSKNILRLISIASSRLAIPPFSHGVSASAAGAVSARQPSRVTRLPSRSSPQASEGWRRERDSNPRAPFGANGFQDRRLKPLGHLSIARRAGDSDGLGCHPSESAKCSRKSNRQGKRWAAGADRGHQRSRYPHHLHPFFRTVTDDLDR